VDTTRFCDNHQRQKIGKPNHLPEISEIEKCKGKYEYIFALRLK